MPLQYQSELKEVEDPVPVKVMLQVAIHPVSYAYALLLLQSSKLCSQPRDVLRFCPTVTLSIKSMTNAFRCLNEMYVVISSL